VKNVKAIPTGSWIMGRPDSCFGAGDVIWSRNISSAFHKTQPKQDREQSSGSTVKSLKPKPDSGDTRRVRRYEVVGMDAAHGDKDLDDLILRLLREQFPLKVDDVVVECGTLYQSVLDRYIEGHEVTLREVGPSGATPHSPVQRVWLSTRCCSR